MKILFIGASSQSSIGYQVGELIAKYGYTVTYVSRSGRTGLRCDITKPKAPKIDQIFNANGEMNDTHDVKVGMVINTAYAFVADGKHGLRVVQLVGPDENEDVYGWSPHPRPKLIATYETEGEALAISKGLDRDRAMDESGNQLSVFNRRGSHPLSKEQLKKMSVVVTNDPPKGKPSAFKRPASEKSAQNSVEEPSKEDNNKVSSNVQAFSFAAIFLPLAILLSRRRQKAS